jgi:hypothetical protein
MKKVNFKASSQENNGNCIRDARVEEQIAARKEKARVPSGPWIKEILQNKV